MLIGIDEAGRGPWAGPLVVAGVLADYKDQILVGINDSKKLSPLKRKHYYEYIIANFQHFVTVIENTDIDRFGLRSSLDTSVNQILNKLDFDIVHQVVIDGNVIYGNRDVDITCIPKADCMYPTVMAASIIAKHTRDQIMSNIDVLMPGYGFASNFGYGTAKHARALELLGASKFHRYTFAPIKNLRRNQP